MILLKTVFIRVLAGGHDLAFSANFQQTDALFTVPVGFGSLRSWELTGGELSAM